MPAIGDQHKPCAALANPFEEHKPHIYEYTAQEIATLSSRLEKQLGPEYISSRPGAAGQKVHYLAAEKCINLANEVLGFNGWSSAVRDLTVDFVDENPTTGKISLGLSVIVRVTLRDGSYHEDIGYGHIENCKGKAAAFEKAKKEGTTDALKRALRNFGNVLGNCIYDKEYLGRVTKLKAPPSKWDGDNLHRHREYASVKKEPVADVSEIATSGNDSSASLRETDDEFGEADFDEADFGVGVGEHPDEVVVETLETPDLGRHEKTIKSEQTAAPQRPASIQAFQQPMAQAPQRHSAPLPAMNAPQTPSVPLNSGGLYQTRSGIAGQPNNAPPQRVQQQQANNQYGNPRTVYGLGSNPQSGVGPGLANSTIPNLSHQGPTLSRNNASNNNSPQKSSNPPESEPLVGFFPGRVAESLQTNRLPPLNVPLFNPKAESPSIRKTQGFDHSKTKPIHRDTLAAPANNPIQSMRSNFVHPQADQTRRIGAPTTASPLQNRNSYKPPQMTKRPFEGSANQFSRPALHDVTATSVNTPIDSGGTDNKRLKLENGQGAQSNGHEATT